MNRCNTTIDSVLLDRVLRSIASPKGRALVSSLVHLNDEVGGAIDRLNYEYKYRCVVDDEMGPANAPCANDLSANLEQSLLEARHALEEISAQPLTSGGTNPRLP